MSEGSGDFAGWICAFCDPEAKAVSRFAPVFAALRLGRLPPQSKPPRAIPKPVASPGINHTRPGRQGGRISVADLVMTGEFRLW
jgi:hypothetical protein